MYAAIHVANQPRSINFYVRTHTHMQENIIRAAIAYDFDDTLAPGNMQEHSFIPKLGIPKEEFWADANQMGFDHDMDGILAYMQFMLEKSREKGIPIKRQDFIDYGRGIRFFPGVEQYFDRITAYARTQNIILDHHIISSGLREFISGTAIAGHFRNIFASGFKYNDQDEAEWAALAVNYTNKTQYLFRINKGIDNSYDNKRVNQHIPEHERPVAFERMIYIGDGETDVPSMKMMNYQGGATIAVFNTEAEPRPGKMSSREICREMIQLNRVDHIVPADYSEGSKLDELIKLHIDKIRINENLKHYKDDQD